MRVGIITILKVDNYGADLQAYALQHQLELMGYEAEIVDYLYYRNHGYKRVKKSYSRFYYPFKLKLRELLLVVRDYYMYIIYHRTTIKREKNFQDFYKKIKFSKTFRTISELYHAKFDYDVYCVGSDQVWNPGNYTNLDPYFLTFAPENARKISYASSFGVSKLPKYSWQYYQNALENLDVISIRESSGKKIISELTGIEATVAVDPTMLLDEQEWKKVEKKINGLPTIYLLVYELKKNHALRSLARHIAEKLHLDIVRLCGTVLSVDNESKVVNIRDAGPMEFIYAFRHASFVVTNSFHGAAFSINFQKDFYVVTSKSKLNNSRFESLLKQYGLTDRLLNDDKLSDLSDITNFRIDFSDAALLLYRLKNKSIEYLKNSIEQ